MIGTRIIYGVIFVTLLFTVIFVCFISRYKTQIVSKEMLTNTSSTLTMQRDTVRNKPKQEMNDDRMTYFRKKGMLHKKIP